MYNILIKLISCLIPVKIWRKTFRHKFLKEVYSPDSRYIRTAYYGKIYVPYYPQGKFSDNELEIYNKDGNKMDVFFLRDKIGAACPYLDASKYFLWDRFNIGLDTHFYTHGTMLETMGNPTHRYGYFVESESIIPSEYAIFDKYKGIEKDFDAIFTYSENLLGKLDNAKLFPCCASIWYGKEIFNGVKDSTILDDNLYQKKSKNISMICSAKLYTPMHIIRHRIANDALNTGKVDMYGGFKNGKMFPYKSTTLKDYRFQIVVENDISSYYFTEKLMDCLISQTIPIYVGATKIDHFFNPEGIISVDKNVEIEKIIEMCTEEEYKSREKAVIDNYNRALKFNNINNLLYETFFIDKAAKNVAAVERERERE